MTKSWTLEATQELRELFAKGLTLYQIAQALSQNHGKISRSAVCAKCGREGLVRGKQNTYTSIRSNPEEDLTWPHPVTAASISFLDLTSRQCKWPVGHETGAKMMCCGASKPLAQPYCAKHSKAARSADQRPFKFTGYKS